MKKLFAIFLLLPAMAFSQQNQGKFFRNTHYPDAQIMFRDSSFIYFQKSPANDTVFKIAPGDVNINPQDVPYSHYDNMGDALLQFNKQNGTGVAMQVAGVGIVAAGSIVVATSGQNSGDQAIVGAAIMSIGSVVSLVGIITEMLSHKHLKRAAIQQNAAPYK